jgi:hypothetical protein
MRTRRLIVKKNLKIVRLMLRIQTIGRRFRTLDRLRIVLGVKKNLYGRKIEPVVVDMVAVSGKSGIKQEIGKMVGLGVVRTMLMEYDSEIKCYESSSL